MLSERIAALLRAHESRDSLVVELASMFEDELQRRSQPGPTWTPDAPATERVELQLGERFEDLGPLGEGGMGEVRRVRDVTLNRTMAMKIVRAELLGDEAVRTRFVEEAQATAQLQHPGIIPVHELGVLGDGRLFFTMQEVRGRSLGHVARGVHMASSIAGEWAEGADGFTFRRLIDAVLRVCEAVAYAHERGVLHRDLKPANVMVGEHGEVQVLDWGLSKVRALGMPGDVQLEGVESQQTVVGVVAGTPAYMAPEQAEGRPDRIGTHTDVYALGALLYAVFTDGAPYAGRALQVLMQVRRGPPVPVVERAPLPVSSDLVAICEKAMARDPADRFGDARQLARRIRGWLDGERRRERAHSIVGEAEACGPQAAALLERAAELEAQAAAQLDDVPAWAPAEDKAGGWALQDEAASLRVEAGLAEFQAEQLLRAALTHERRLPEAHAALVERHLAEHRRAEVGRDEEAVARARVLLEIHAAALPEEHAARVEVVDYLQGTGALTLQTDPPGAEVLLHRLEPVARRLEPVFERSLGTTPLDRAAVGQGSWLCVLRAPGRADVRYPIQVDRQGHWDAGPPVPLPAGLGDDEIYVPGGPFLAAGDPKALLPRPRERLWCDGFVMQRQAVTQAQYVAFLDDLVDRGTDEDTIAVLAPRERGGAGKDLGPVLYGRMPDGHFQLVPDADGDLWEAEWPVFMVDWACARAYALWLSDRTGLPWRLPMELEREKAARGVDGRIFPWGDRFDPSFAGTSHSHRRHRQPFRIGEFGRDCSVYGVEGLSGTIRDWCGHVFADDAHVRDGRVQVLQMPDVPAVKSMMATRGSAWTHTARESRAASRGHTHPHFRSSSIGIRLVRSVESE